MDDVIIIGAGTAGLTAAVYTGRAGKKAVVYEAETYGGQIINTPEVQNYPGIKHISGFDFASGLYEQAKAVGTEFAYERVIRVEKNSAGGFDVISDSGSRTAKAVIAASGAKNRHLDLPGEERLSGRGVSYCATCDGAFFRGRETAVFGGGNTALEDALYLSELCSKVTLIHRRDEFRGEAVQVELLKRKSNVEFMLSSVVTELVGEDALSAVRVKNVITGEVTELKVSGLFTAIGQIPSNEAVRGLVELDEKGYIIAGEDCRTSVPGVFAAGDGRTKTVRQLTTAAADGAVASVGACAYIAGAFA